MHIWSVLCNIHRLTTVGTIADCFMTAGTNGLIGFSEQMYSAAYAPDLCSICFMITAVTDSEWCGRWLGSACMQKNHFMWADFCSFRPVKQDFAKTMAESTEFSAHSCQFQVNNKQLYKSGINTEACSPSMNFSAQSTTVHGACQTHTSINQ